MANSSILKEYINEKQVVISCRKLLLPQTLVGFRTASKNENQKNMDTAIHPSEQQLSFSGFDSVTRSQLSFLEYYQFFIYLYDTFIFFNSFSLS
jgi:hypothetical protein